MRDIIFPIEREFRGERAREEAPRFFRELARNGTTTAAIFAAIYEDGCEAAFEAAQASGLRAIIGKMMMMDTGGNPQPRDVLDVSLAESERLCRKWHGADDGRLEYAFSPRFAVTFSEIMMREAARLASERDAFLQTHLAESDAEVRTVRGLFPTAIDYAGVYEGCGLLTRKTLQVIVSISARGNWRDRHCGRERDPLPNLEFLPRQRHV